MRKRDSLKEIGRLKAENTALKAELATLKGPVPIVPTPTPAQPKPASAQPETKKSVGRPRGAKNKLKAEEPKEEPTPADISAANQTRRGPLAVLTPEQLARQHGSAGYDDLVSPINDHDKDWRATSAKITAAGGYQYE